MECRTMAIKWGTNKTRLFLYVLIALTVAGLFLVNGLFIHFPGTLTLQYITFGLTLPFCLLCYFIYIAKVPADFHQAANLSKFIMLIGVMYCFVFYYLQAKSFGISLFNLFMVQ